MMSQGGVAELTAHWPGASDEENTAAQCVASTFLITGSVAADVEAVARRIHAASLRARRPFVRVPAAELPADPLSLAEVCANLIGQATGGTLLVVNVEDTPAEVQDLLLETFAALQYARDPGASVRLVAGTTQTLLDRVANGTFSERLFYRLNLIHVVVTRDSIALVALPA